jgi:predicted nucleic acid-binding protein
VIQRADYLVKGDRALQNLKTYKATRIVSPRFFLALLREQSLQ